MTKAIALLTLTLLGATAALAGGRVVIHNETNGKIEVFAYDQDDSVRAVPSERGVVDPGGSRQFDCKKNLFDANASGCHIYIREWEWSKELMSDRFLSNGEYEATGRWHRNQTGPGIVFDESFDFKAR